MKHNSSPLWNPENILHLWNYKHSVYQYHSSRDSKKHRYNMNCNCTGNTVNSIGSHLPQVHPRHINHWVTKNNYFQFRKKNRDLKVSPRRWHGGNCWKQNRKWRCLEEEFNGDIEDRWGALCGPLTNLLLFVSVITFHVRCIKYNRNNTREVSPFGGGGVGGSVHGGVPPPAPA